MHKSVLERLLAQAAQQQLTRGVLGAAALLALPVMALGGELALGRVSGQVGKPVTVPVTLTGFEPWQLWPNFFAVSLAVK